MKNGSEYPYPTAYSTYMLLDMDILIHSSFFIGTYTSNVSRIVPLYVGFEKSLSLDDEWKL